MSITIKWKDGTQTEYPDCNRIDSNGVQGLIGKEVDGVMEVFAAVPMEDVAEVINSEKLAEGGQA